MEYNIEVKIKDKEVLAQLDQKIEQTLKQACILVQDSAKQNCPVRTGRLQGSISHQVDKKEGIVGTNVEYAPYVEAGTSRFEGRHFLERAGDQNREKILDLFKGLI